MHRHNAHLEQHTLSHAPYQHIHCDMHPVNTLILTHSITHQRTN